MERTCDECGAKMIRFGLSFNPTTRVESKLCLPCWEAGVAGRKEEAAKLVTSMIERATTVLEDVRIDQ